MHEEELSMVIDMATEQMQKAIKHLELELSHVRAGRASIVILDGVRIDYYGALTPLNQVANLSTPDARTIAIQPWDKKMLSEIEKAILAANLGLTPMNNGDIIRLNFPPLTEERRRDLVKQVKHMGETTKISIRNFRKDGNEEIKKLQKDGLAEDMAKDGEDRIQKLTDKFIAEVDKHLGVKEAEIMTV
ncbi:MAG TPA: ribosome recycling factor [Chitinophagales bacterium]|nr:ribosome recycling factor [Chitinophagales bacterium]HMU68597.1 ribosome recycling factor [Chitinophagales bacterium]HMX03501.1 ribosome recycling factor [Chitinophagales bacterium]HMZ89887.1 ribosome recycling factor [Chitinophagales bacterium]HNE45993.1 ribosome recycling factor [Chitinophagales bacterium]